MRLTEEEETPMSKEKRPDDPKQLREMVSEGYARVARQASSCCAETSATVTRRRPQSS